jgi:hypothetical protein
MVSDSRLLLNWLKMEGILLTQLGNLKLKAALQMSGCINLFPRVIGGYKSQKRSFT